MSSLTDQMARWMLGLRFQDLPEDVMESTKLRVLDTVGLMLGASVLDYGRAVREAALEIGPVGGTAHVLGFGDLMSPALAAMVNGALAEGFTFSDTHNETMLHASAPIVATALALGEHTNATGAEVLTAIAGGTELTCRMGVAAPGLFKRSGFDPTGILGTLGATFVACRLLGLDADRTRNAVGVAGSQAGGLLESVADGSWAHLLHPGWAAHTAVAAAYLGKSGFQGPAAILEGRLGLLRAHVQDPSLEFDLERVLNNLGHDWESRYISLKPYPCAHMLHPYIDAALTLRHAGGFKADQIKQVTCPIAEPMVALVCEPSSEKLQPATYIQARYSLPYVLAEALTLGKVDFRSFNTKNIQDKTILHLAQKISYVVDPDAPGPWQYRGWVVIETTDGKSHEHVEEYNRGSAENPIGIEELAGKFQQMASLALPNKVDDIIDAVIALEQLGSISELTEQAIRLDAARRMMS